MVKKRGLGKSLDALLVGSMPLTDESDPYPAAPQEKIKHLSVDVIRRGKYQPRREMKPEALEELANSIRAQGIIQPIIVRQILGGQYEIIAGERRWRAAQMAGLTEVPAIVRDIPDEAAVAIALIENIQREDLNPIEEAIALERLLEEFSLTHHQVAEAVGKSRATVTNLLRLLTLTDDVKMLLEQGKLEMGHARALLSLTPELQLDVAQTIVSKQLSVRETENLVRRMQLPPTEELAQSPDPDVVRLQESLTHRIKLPVAIQHNAKGRGKFIIQYKNLTDLDRILEYFQ